MKAKGLLPAVVGASALLVAGAAAAQPSGGNWNGAYAGVLAGVQFGGASFALPGDKADVLQSDHVSKTAFSAGGMIGFNAVMRGGWWAWKATWSTPTRPAPWSPAPPSTAAGPLRTTPSPPTTA